MGIHSWGILATVNGGEMIELLARIIVLFQIIFGYLREIIELLELYESILIIIVLLQLYICMKLHRKNENLKAKIAFLRSVNLSWSKYFDKIVGPKEDEEWKQILEGKL